MRDQAKELERREVQVLVVLPQEPSHIRSAFESYGIQRFGDFKALLETGKNTVFPILGDPASTVSATYGVAFQGFDGTFNRPGTFVIDRKGVVRYAKNRGGLSDQPSPGDLLNVIDGMVVAESRKDAKLVPDRFAGMDPYIHSAMEKWEVPGLAIAVVKDGETVLARRYGVCEIGTDRKVMPDTVFGCASCTKAFTAAWVAMLVDEGKLTWDDPVVKHLPSFELGYAYLTKHVTLRDLLCHRIGLPRAKLLPDDPPEILRRIKYIEPIADLRTKFTYNDAMYVLAGEVVTRVSGRPWEQFAAERIFKPLHMNSTQSSLKDIAADRHARRHWNSDGGIVARPFAREAPSAARSIHSTVVDMAQWVKLQLAEGQIEGRRLLSEKSVREMHAMQFAIPVTISRLNIYTARMYGTGLGWQILDYRGRKVVRHGGGCGAWVAMIPEEKLGVVLLSNLDFNGLVGMLMYDLLDAYLAGPEAAWDRSKWETWLRLEGPGYAYRPRDEAKAQLEKLRTKDTKRSLPLEQYAATFESKLYGPLVVRHDGGRLSISFQEFTTEISHWQDDSFYVRSPTRLTYDWLLTFRVSKDGEVADVTVKHVGWDKDEKDQLFVRGK